MKVNDSKIRMKSYLKFGTKIFAVVLILLFSLLSIVGIVRIVLIWFLENRSTERKQEEEGSVYLYRSVNPSNGYSSVGYVSLDEDLEIGEYKYYHNSVTDIHTIITNFGSKAYQCTGTCFCSEDGNIVDEDRRTSSTHILSRGLFVLVSAVSAFTAVEAARDHFQRECKNIFSEKECPKGFIVSIKEDDEDDEECIDLFEDDDPNWAETEFDHTPKRSFTSFDYMCYGPCIPKLDELEEKYVEEYGLDFDEILGTHSQLSTITERLIQRMVTTCQGLNGKLSVAAITKEWAIWVFLRKLDEVCVENSQVEGKKLRKMNTDLTLLDPEFMKGMGSFCKAPKYDDVFEDMRTGKKVAVWCERELKKPRIVEGHVHPDDEINVENEVFSQPITEEDGLDEKFDRMWEEMERINRKEEFEAEEEAKNPKNE